MVLDEGKHLCSDIFDQVVMRAEDLKMMASSGATSNKGLQSPVSLNMDLYPLQDDEMPGAEGLSQ